MQARRRSPRILRLRRNGRDQTPGDRERHVALPRRSAARQPEDHCAPCHEVTRLDGENALESISLGGPAGEVKEQACSGLFCFIGAEPATSWLTDVALDEHGFVRTDVQLTSDELGETLTALGRAPLPFETSVPGVFAVGDVRHGSMKRVAAAVGEGASAVRSVHAAIGVRA